MPYRCSIGRIGALSRLVVRKFHLILGSAGSDSKSINSLRPRQTPAACSLLPNKKRLAQTTHRPCASCARRLQLLANARPTGSGRSRNTVGRPTKEYRSIDFSQTRSLAKADRTANGSNSPNRRVIYHFNAPRSQSCVYAWTQPSFERPRRLPQDRRWESYESYSKRSLGDSGAKG